MDVSEAVARRMSVRAFKSDPVPGAVVRRVLEAAHQAPSGGNLQPWRVYALAGEPLARFKALALATPMQEPEYEVYPANLWDPYRKRRFECGEDLYASIGIPREDRPGRFAQLANNLSFFGAPVGLFFCLDRKMGPPQWADVGMYMQTVMLLAQEQGLDTCAQEFWARHQRGIKPYSEGKVTALHAWDAGTGPIKTFMIDQIWKTKHEHYCEKLYEYSSHAPDTVEPVDLEDYSLSVIAPAFLLSELTTALFMGFAIYLPFLVIDLVVSAVLGAMGLFMLPPAMVALPLKLVLFVLADGWMLVSGMLLRSFA